MYPLLFESKYFIIQSLWLMVSLAFILGSLFFLHLAKRESLRLNFILNHGFKIVFISVIVSRIVYVLQNTDIFFYELSLSHLKFIFYIWDKGLSFWGAIFGLVLGLLHFCRKYDEDIWRWLDIITPAFFTALSIGTIGLFLDGQSYGYETNLPWGINFENIMVLYSVPVHPTQLYAFIYNAILAGVSYYFLTRHRYEQSGNLFLTITSAFCLLKFLEEFFRGDISWDLLGIRTAQFYAFFIGLISFLLLLERYNRVNLQPIRNFFAKIRAKLPFKKEEKHESEEEENSQSNDNL